MKIRRIIGAVFSVLLSTVIIFSATTSALAQGVVIKGEPDGQNKSTVMDEHFYSGSLEPNFTSDSVEKFKSLGGLFLGEPMEMAEKVEIDRMCENFAISEEM